MTSQSFQKKSAELKRFCADILAIGPLFVVLFALVLGLSPGVAGAPPASAPQQQSPGDDPKQSQENKSAGEAARATVDEPEQKISPKEAQELFRQVDQILKFASKDSNLPIKHDVKRRLTTRDEVVAYLQKSMAEDKDAQRLRRSELVLKKFGLLPADFNLQDFLLKLLREQVAGYYDPKTKTVNLLDWIAPDAQRPVMAHELTHALLDQSFGLEKWMKKGDIDLDEIKNPTPEDLERDEVSEARQAVVEGQAMVVLVDYMLAPTGKSLLTSPELANALKEGMMGGTSDSPAFQDAPVFLKEALTFPYRYGLDFEAELLRNGGKDKAFVGAFTEPPKSTRQIMEPKTYLSGEHIEPMHLPDFDQDFKNYDRFDIGAMGEFDVGVLVDQYAGAETSHAVYPQWRGGYYYAVKPKGGSTSSLALLYVSRWSDPASAAQFAAIYAKALPTRYKHIHETIEEVGTRDTASRESEVLTGTHTWLTEQGTVVITVHQANVFISEGLDQSTTDKLQHEVLGLGTAGNQ